MMATELRSHGVGLALSGGAARGIAHAGVLEILVEAGVAVRAVAGTSAGAIVGALFAAGATPSEIGRLALETRWSDLFRGGIALHDLSRGPELLRRGREAARTALPSILALTGRRDGTRSCKPPCPPLAKGE